MAGNKFDDIINQVLEASPHYKDANDQLRMSPQEQELYKHHLMQLGNGGFRQPDGGTSTVYMTQIGDEGQPTVNVPSVYDNKILSVPDTIQRAVTNGLEKYPSYPTADEAKGRYALMHQFMEQDTNDKEKLVDGH